MLLSPKKGMLLDPEESFRVLSLCHPHGYSMSVMPGNRFINKNKTLVLEFSMFLQGTDLLSLRDYDPRVFEKKD